MLLLGIVQVAENTRQRTLLSSLTTSIETYRGVLLDVQPPHVREEKTARRVVRVRVLLRVLVVHPVVSGPVVNRPLVGHRVDEHEKHSSDPVRVVRSVRPQTVYPAGDSKTPD